MTNDIDGMDRISLRLPTGQMKRLDRQVNRGEYPNRSEAIRQYIRDGLKGDEADEDGRPRPLAIDG